MKNRNLLLTVAVFLGMTFGLTAQNIPSYVPTNGLVGWWPFNGNANDESGNGNNGTVNGATLTADRFGNAGKAYSFDGLNDFILTSYLGILGDTSRSISVWAKSDSAIYFSTLVGYGSKESIISGGTDRILFYIRKVDFEGIALDIDGGRVTYQCTPLDNNWHHYVFVFDKTISPSVADIKIYFDGILLTNKTENYVPFPAAGIINTQPEQPVVFGGFPLQNDPNPLWFNGKLDDISMYNRALSQQEITSLYQGGNTSANCPTFPASLAQGLVGYWPFCGNALDESGNGNNGTINGAALTTDRFGNAGSAYRFDGVNDYITTSYVFPTGSLSKSYSVWFKINDLGQRGWIIGNNLDCTTPGSIGTYGLFLEGNLPFSRLLFNGNSVDIDFESTLISNAWYNAVVCYDGFSVKCYLNGFLKNTQVTTLNTSLSSNLLFGGRSVLIPSTCPEEFLEGNIDDIAIWNRALTPQEIQQVYNQGICQTSITVTDTLLIHTGITSYNPVAYQNTLKVWPNPGNQDITIDAGNLALMQGWKIRVSNAQGVQIYPSGSQSGLINQQQQTLDMSSWGGNGLYFLYLIDPQNNIQEVKKIVLAP